METNEISYSMYIDHQKLPEKNKSLCSIQQRQLHKWVEDKLVNQCYRCDKEFGMWVRKHHCRMCGHIFCYECTDIKMTIPRDYPNNLPIPFDGYHVKIDQNVQLRMCKPCQEKVKQFTAVQKLIKIFSLIELDIFDYKNKIKKVCQVWQHLGNHYISTFRELQYKLPRSTLSSFEKQILWSNRNCIVGHSQYIVQLLRSVHDPDKIIEALKISMSKYRKYQCHELLCTRDCNTRITAENALDLLTPETSSIEIKKYAVSLLDQANDTEFICYVPFLVHAISFDGLSVIANYLIQRCKCKTKYSNIKLCNEVYWQLKINIHHKVYGNVYRHVLTHFKRSVKFETQFKIIDLVGKIRTQVKLDQINTEKCYSIILPTNPKISNATVYIRNVTILKSATRPLFIPYTFNHPKDGPREGALLFKNEDLRKDQIIMASIKLMDIILKKELNDDFNIMTYPVRPTDIGSGFIGIVPDAETIYNIKEKNMTILNYIIEHNKDETVQTVKDRFIKSCAAYCVITYLLGIGDRHLDNIMITKKGELFHIDFGYILGLDPKIIGTPAIRISMDIVEALGGQNSSDYRKFCEMCATVYSCLRRHVNLFVNMMHVLIDTDQPSIILTEQVILNEILNRFVPGEVNQEAKLQLYNRIDNSSTANYSYYIIDFFHRQNKETPKIVKAFLSNTYTTARSVVQTAIDTIYY